jgi:hypothetical protein
VTKEAWRIGTSRNPQRLTPGSTEEEVMPHPADLRFRAAGPGDAHAIAELHADSWQQHYPLADAEPSGGS